jgi:hypothetical protein
MSRCRTVLLTVALVLTVAAVHADAPKELLGTWKRTAGENTLQFVFKADALEVRIADGAGASITISADYKIDKDMVSGVVKKVEKQNVEGGPAEGDKFSFRVKIDQDTLTLSELKGTDSEEARQLVEGAYKKAK